MAVASGLDGVGEGMGGVNKRVQGFLEAGQRKRQVDDLQCAECGDKLEDGEFAVIDGDMVCLNCMKAGINGPREGGVEERHG